MNLMGKKYNTIPKYIIIRQPSTTFATGTRFLFRADSLSRVPINASFPENHIIYNSSTTSESLTLSY